MKLKQTNQGVVVQRDSGWSDELDDRDLSDTESSESSDSCDSSDDDAGASSSRRPPPKRQRMCSNGTPVQAAQPVVVVNKPRVVVWNDIRRKRDRTENLIRVQKMQLLMQFADAHGYGDQLMPTGGKYPKGVKWQDNATDLRAMLNAYVTGDKRKQLAFTDVGFRMNGRIGLDYDSVAAMTDGYQAKFAAALKFDATEFRTWQTCSPGGGHVIFKWPDGVPEPANTCKTPFTDLGFHDIDIRAARFFSS